ncbi:MAG: TonB-dependent receptor, partial [Novosphingobium sp.]|nr:TonB-dependent receptor [Novosphingobium sp.]
MKAVSKGNILATGLLASIPALAHAQTTDDASAANQGDIIVTAQKREQRLTEVPLSIISQSAEQLKAAGVVTTKDLTKVVPGLVYTQNEAFAQPAIRGVSTTLTTA